MTNQDVVVSRGLCGIPKIDVVTSRPPGVVSDGNHIGCIQGSCPGIRPHKSRVAHIGNQSCSIVSQSGVANTGPKIQGGVSCVESYVDVLGAVSDGRCKVRPDIGQLEGRRKGTRIIGIHGAEDVDQQVLAPCYATHCIMV